MDVTTLLGGINIAVTLGAGLLLWWGLSAKFDEVEHFLAAKTETCQTGPTASRTVSRRSARPCRGVSSTSQDHPGSFR